MGDERYPKDMAKTLHLRGNLCIRATAVSHNDAAIIDDAPGAGAVQELKGPIEKDPGLEAGEDRVVLDKEFP